MKIFGFTISRTRPLPAPEEDFFQAVDSFNEAWTLARERGMTYSPWLIWDEKRMVVTDFKRNVVKD